MLEVYIGEIRLMSFPFAPKGWAYCQGQTLSINQNNALFSLIGTTYGGDGVSTFALPDLRGRVAVGNGQGPGLNSYNMGDKGGADGTVLTPNQIPSHSHDSFSGTISVADELTRQSPVGSFPFAADPNTLTPYSTGTPDGTMSTAAVPATSAAGGAGQPHENRQPLLGLNYAIALTGIYPSRQ